LAIVERKFSRKIIRGPKLNNFTQRYEIRSNKEIYNAFGEPNIIGVIRPKRLSWLVDILRSNMIEKEALSC